MASLGTARHNSVWLGAAPHASSWAPLGLGGGAVAYPLSTRVTGELRWVGRAGVILHCHPPQQWVFGGGRAPGFAAISPRQRRL